MPNVLSTDKQVAVISALAEGSGIRQIERITGVHRGTIKPRKAGRPPLPKGRAKARMLRVRVTPEELRAIESKARRSKQSVSQWIRSTLNAVL